MSGSFSTTNICITSRLTQSQHMTLEEVFKSTQNPSKRQIIGLSKKLGVNENNIQAWFINRKIQSLSQQSRALKDNRQSILQQEELNYRKSSIQIGQTPSLFRIQHRDGTSKPVILLPDPTKLINGNYKSSDPSLYKLGNSTQLLRAHQ